MAASILAVRALDLTAHGVAVTGRVPTGLSVGLPDVGFSQLTALAVGAVSVIFVGYSESLASARTMAEKHRYEIDPNQELIAQGMCWASSSSNHPGDPRRRPVAPAADRPLLPDFHPPARARPEIGGLPLGRPARRARGDSRRAGPADRRPALLRRRRPLPHDARGDGRRGQAEGRSSSTRRPSTWPIRTARTSSSRSPVSCRSKESASPSRASARPFSSSGAAPASSRRSETAPSFGTSLRWSVGRRAGSAAA
jgi:Sulfate permease family